MVGVAQLAERCVVVADVAGSSPVTHPIVSRLALPSVLLRGPTDSPEGRIRPTAVRDAPGDRPSEGLNRRLRCSLRAGIDLTTKPRVVPPTSNPIRFKE